MQYHVSVGGEATTTTTYLHHTTHTLLLHEWQPGGSTSSPSVMTIMVAELAAHLQAPATPSPAPIARRIN